MIKELCEWDFPNAKFSQNFWAHNQKFNKKDSVTPKETFFKRNGTKRLKQSAFRIVRNERHFPLCVCALFFSSETAESPAKCSAEWKFIGNIVTWSSRVGPNRAVALLWKIHSCNTFQVVYLPDWRTVDCLAGPKRMYRAAAISLVKYYHVIKTHTRSGSVPPREECIMQIYMRERRAVNLSRDLCDTDTYPDARYIAQITAAADRFESVRINRTNKILSRNFSRRIYWILMDTRNF